MGKIINKIKSHKGFSLTEMLTTVLIMTIVLAGITAGVTTAMRVYRQIRLAANAQTLMATAITAINGDLRTASDIGGTATDPVFYSGSRGYRMQFVAGKDRNAGNICVKAVGTETATNQNGTVIPIVTDKTKTEDLQMTIEFIKTPPAASDNTKTEAKDQYFEYKITISKTEHSNSTMADLTRTVCVRPISGE